MMAQREYAYNFCGHERVLHNVDACRALPLEMDRHGYRRAFLVCSHSLNTKTDVIRSLVASLGDRLVGMTDKVGEHAPIANVLAAAIQARDAGADVIISVGGGSVIDLCRGMQLCISEDIYTQSELLKCQFQMTAAGPVSGSKAPAAIRQICIPTTLATAEWTSVTTPVDEETHLKATFLVPMGGPQVILYDPEILGQTPAHLILSTAIRGLDHAINTRCAVSQHPLASRLAEDAIKLYVENLPLLKQDGSNRDTLSSCQLATWYTGMGQMSVMHGFSHFMVHVVGPYARVSHGDAACVLMLAQAKWLEGYVDESHKRIKAILGKEDLTVYRILHDLLDSLGMPKTLGDLGISRAQADKLAELALQHPLVTLNNVRPIETLDDVKAVMALAQSVQEQ